MYKSNIIEVQDYWQGGITQKLFKISVTCTIYRITTLASKIKLRQGHIHTTEQAHLFHIQTCRECNTHLYSSIFIYTFTLGLLEILRSELDINITGEVNTFERTLHISHYGGLRSTYAYFPLRDRRQHT